MPHQAAEFSRDAAAALAAELSRRIQGEVRFDDGNRALYATDASNYRQVPIGVVIPRRVEDIVETVALCRAHRAPVLARGGGTSLAGQCCNTAVVIDTSKYLHRVLAIDPERRRARVEPGCILDHLRDQAERHHLTFGPDPATHDHNTLGGMIGNNSCGVHSVMAGRTADNVYSLDVLTYDGLRLAVGPTAEDEIAAIIRQGGRRGEIYAGLKTLQDKYAELIRQRYPAIPRRVSGYNLDELLPERGFNVARALVGSEGTCITVLEAELRLVPSPPSRTLVVLGYPDIYRAGDHVPEILEHNPIGLEGIDEILIEYMEDKHMHPQERKLLPEGKGWLLVEFGGNDSGEANENARRMIAALKNGRNPPAIELYDDPGEVAGVWAVRESGLGATAHLSGGHNTWEGWEDAGVPPARVGDYLRDFRKLLDRYDYACSLYGHFGDGCVHVRIDFDLQSREGIDKYKAFTADAADLVLRYGGSLSGEHGDGQARGDLLNKMYGEELIGAMREFKRIWDPLNRMNPGKVIDPFPRDANLRLGTDYREPELPTAFAYRDDAGSFAHAMLRCVGVGVCRHVDKGVMCPSYMATREEMHSTRGRARLLFEMVHGMTHPGDPLRDGWRDETVREALDLCLACKGCLRDCPVDVDMATYKAEFNHHYYQGRLRPRAAYSMGLIYRWSRLASLAPRFANTLLRTPGLAAIAKAAGGIARERRLPPFAPHTFRAWFRRRPASTRHEPKVLLFPDTFNNHWQPEVLIAAVEVLEAAGFCVEIPRLSLCCGRPLYAWGMLDRARRQLGKIIYELAVEAFGDTPIVGLEPACVAALRDELVKLYPDDQRAGRLAQRTFMLGEFLAQHTDYRPPPLPRRALVHRHCHHHAVIGFAGEQQLLEAMGLDYTLPDSGCCGMAGSFGFEAEHYELSLKIGERVLLPAVREADPDTLIITDGYSCREQIAQSTERRALHLAEVLQLALRESLSRPTTSTTAAPATRAGRS